MLSRITVNVLLKSVIATLAMAVVVVLSMGAWTSWNRLAAISRIASVSETSAHLFRALHLLRTDRATTTRDLNSEQALPSMTQQNSALVEENAATAKALELQAQSMDDHVGYFHINADDAATAHSIPQQIRQKSERHQHAALGRNLRQNPRAA